ncbi:MAG: MFS transporter [Thermoplasmata archaeon]|nr:MFS transporter [Thermoplasmata archaeon]
MRLPYALRFLSSAAMAMTWVFIPIYADDLGIGALVIGFIVAANALALLISSWVFGRAADMYGRRMFVIIGLFGAVVAFALLSTANSAREMMAYRFACGFFDGMFGSALVAYVAEQKGPLGRFTSFGPAGMAAGFLIAGSIMVNDMPTNTIFLLSAAVLAMTAIIALGLPRVHEPRLHVPRVPVDIIRRNKHLYLAIFLRHTGASIAWVIFPLYEQSLGLSRALIAYIWMPNFAMQVIVMNYADRIRNSHWMVIGGLSAAAASFALFIGVKEWYTLIPGMVLIGISWAFLYLGALFELMERNEERATASGLLNSSTSFSGIIGPLMGGAIAAEFGYTANLVAAVIFVMSALILYLAIAPRSRGRRDHMYDGHRQGTNGAGKGRSSARSKR